MAENTVQLTDQLASPVAVIRRQTPQRELSRVVPECCGLVWNVIRAQQAKAGRNVAIYWDGAIRLEVGVELLGPFVERDDVVQSLTPAGLVASTTHVGPYQTLGQAHRRIVEWCRAHGHRLAGPNWEIYGHWKPEWNNDPSLIQTDVHYLVAGE